MIQPKDALLCGLQPLQRVLSPNGFLFHFRGEGVGSGGAFAWGEFTKEDCRLELHFRFTLGLVTYHVAEKYAHHETYMRELGVWEQCRYPGFSSEPPSAFEGLAHDLRFAEDFLSGTAEILQRAGGYEAAENARAAEQLIAAAAGDTLTIEQMGDHFRELRYSDVLKSATELKFPERLTAPERRMIEIARRKTNERIG
jgi:hypothetical protein